MASCTCLSAAFLEQDVVAGNLNVSTNYSYDALGRLIRIDQGSPIGAFSCNQQFRLIL
jgi:hypothetical protein